MKGWVPVAIAAVMLGLTSLWYIASPWITLYGIKAAVEHRDVEAMIAYVDFDALRENLKEQAHADMDRRAKPAMPVGWSVPDESTRTAAIDRQIDLYVTPETARALFAKSGGSDSSSSESVGSITEMVRDIAISRESFGRFVVGGRSDKTGMGAVFTAHGLSWRLSGIRLPAGAARLGALGFAGL